MLNPKIFIIAMVLVLGLGLGSIYWYKSALNNPTSPPQVLIANKPVTSEPYQLQLDLTSPDDNLLIFDSTLLVSGKTSPQAVVLISLDDTDKFIKADSVGSFSQTIKAREGLNNLEITAFDSLGNNRKEIRTIYYSTEKL